jgi:hypothetical protein
VENRSTHIGGVIKLMDCCREVKLGAVPCTKGDVLSGWNTLTDQYEEYEVVKVDKKDNWYSLVKRVK